MIENQKKFIPISIILLIALLLRILGINYGLPFLYRIEEAIPVHIAGQLASGHLHSKMTFIYPLLLSALLALEYGFYFICCILSGKVDSLGAFKDLYFQDPTWFYLLGRLTSLFFGMATLLVIYRLAARIYDRTTGLLASFLLVFFPMHFIQSRIIRVDVLLIFFTSISMIYIYSIYNFNRWRDNILAGLFAGLALASKYNGFFVIIPLFLSHVFYAREKEGKWITGLSVLKFFTAVGVMILTFLPASPFTYLGISGGFAAFQNLRVALLRSPSISSLSRTSAILPFSFSYSAAKIGGTALTCVIGLTLIYFIFKGSKKAWLIIAPLIISFVLLTFSTQPFLEYLSPWLYMSLILVSRLIIELKNKIRSPRLQYIFLSCLLLIIIANPLRIILKRVYLSIQVDTRTMAYQWVIKNIPAGTKIAMENNIPPIKSRENEGIPSCDKFKTIDIPNYGGSLFGGEDWIRRTEENTPIIKDLSRQGVQVVIVNSSNYEKYQKFPELFPCRLKFYQSLNNRALLWKEIKAEPEKRYGPTIRIYQITDEDLVTQPHILSSSGRD